MPPDRLSTTLVGPCRSDAAAILARLAHGEASVKELAEPFEMSLPAVSKHLKVLQRAGLISSGREAQWRPCRLEGDRCATSRLGWRTTAVSGTRASIASTRISKGFRRETRMATATDVSGGRCSSQ